MGAVLEVPTADTSATRINRTTTTERMIGLTTTAPHLRLVAEDNTMTGTVHSPRGIDQVEAEAAAEDEVREETDP